VPVLVQPIIVGGRFPLVSNPPPWGKGIVAPPCPPSEGDIEAAVEDVERAGGKLLRRGEFCPGCPYACVSDPDGYEVEFWYK
jgi:hypothetical protein